MKRYNIFNAFFYSLFSNDFYYSVYKSHKLKTAFFYLVIVAILTTVPGIIKGYTILDNFLKNEGKAIFAQVPEVSINNGKVTTKVETPYYIKHPVSNDIIAIIDPENKVDNFYKTGAFVLIQESKAIIKISDSGSREIKLSEVPSFVINSSVVTKWGQYSYIFYFVSSILGLLIVYFVKVLQVFITSQVVFLITLFRKYAFHFRNILNLALYAATFAFIFETVIRTFEINLPALDMIVFFIMISYTLFAAKSVFVIRMNEVGNEVDKIV